MDHDKSGTITFKEFQRKLEHYGVKNRSREEFILTCMIEAVSKSQVRSLAKLF
jgi:hypothetical protein